MIKAVVFDMDGVLVDSEKHQVNAEIATLREYGIELTHDLAKDYMGVTLTDYFKALSEKFDVDFPIEEAVARHRKSLDKYYGEVFPLVPHAKKLVETLSPNYLLGLSTSTGRSNAEAILKKFGIMDYLKASTCGDEVLRGKPDPEVFSKTIEALGIEPNEVVVIEDSGHGMRAAKAAGAVVIARKAGHNEHQDFSIADYIVEDLMDVEKILNKLS
jgi:HAD superfamily hydrolase (TIGR01509 family)